MKRNLRYTFVAILAALASPAQAEVAIDVIGGSEVSLEGLLQADGNWFDNDVLDLNGPDGGNGDDSEFELRRAEFVLKGKGVKWDWVAGYDAKADKFLDTNVRYRMGTHYAMAGQYKQPNSLEELTSTRHNDFIAKSMTTNLFGIARRVGVAYGVDEASWGFAASAFGRELTRNLAHGAGYGVRAYWTPVRESGHFIHLGASVADYDTDADTLRLRVRPDADLATARLIDTGALRNADRQTTVGLEAAYVQGPFKLQGEYMASRIDRYDSGFAAQPGDDFSADSWYVYGVWNVTGETWGYKAGTPTTPYANDPASGMWQVAVRYDAADLDDAPVFGGEERNLTLGVNWYWRSNFKLQLNYVMARSERFSPAQGVSIDDDPNIVEARAQFYW
ncbi:MAG TPA: OprO/OprP family phosphate-selective porin [Xanthomonadales bacterium]|nr:OprO/OprP family phosphate-selective porin [Xanthomonadales bacterium]